MTFTLDSLNAHDAAVVTRAGTRLTLPAQWSPIKQHTGADKAYIILSGEVSVRRDGVEIARLGAGDIVGETGIVRGKLRTATIVTLTPVELLHYTAEEVRTLCARVPAFAEALGSVAADRSPAA